MELFRVGLYISRRFNSTLAVTPRLLDLRIGKIVEIKKHENADKLYVSQVAVSGAKPDESSQGKLDGNIEHVTKTVQVCSGLVGFVPKSELLNKRVVLVMNLKPSKMRGVRSEAMLLAAEKRINNTDIIPNFKVQVVQPPEHGEIGQSLQFKGFEGELGDELRRVNRKKWEKIASGLKTNNKGEVCYIDESCTLGFDVDNWREVCTVSNEFTNCKVR